MADITSFIDADLRACYVSQRESFHRWYKEVLDESLGLKKLLLAFYSAVRVAGTRKDKLNNAEELIFDHLYRRIQTVAFAEGLVELLGCSPLADNDIARVDRLLKGIHWRHERLCEIKKLIDSIDRLLAPPATARAR